MEGIDSLQLEEIDFLIGQVGPRDFFRAMSALLLRRSDETAQNDAHSSKIWLQWAKALEYTALHMEDPK